MQYRPVLQVFYVPEQVRGLGLGYDREPALRGERADAGRAGDKHHQGTHLAARRHYTFAGPVFQQPRPGDEFRREKVPGADELNISFQTGFCQLAHIMCLQT